LGLYLIGAAFNPTLALNILWVVVGLGMMIFVHELGHFLVAKLSGVKCEKFYLGFDILGLKLLKFTWGETQYGVGILPLGGYVKMLGQEDNPARLRQELERAQARAAAGEPDAPGMPGSNAEAPDARQAAAIDLEAAKQALYDPRSYLAKSVPKRMAIISAGVIMNVLFAFLMAIVAYKIGVRQVESVVGAVVPGDAAWQLNLKVGDRIEQVSGKPVRRFTDLKAAVSLGDLDRGLSILVRRPGLDEPFRVTAVPDRMGLAPTIGVGLPRATTLAEQPPVFPGSSAAKARPQFMPGDQIIEINGHPIDSYAQIHRLLARHPDETLRVTVRRKANQRGAPSRAPDRPEQVTIEVAPMPMKRLGLVMQIGSITAIQEESPAARADIRPGDRILRVDGRPPGDPMTLPDRLRCRGDGDGDGHVTLTLARRGQAEPVEVQVPLRQAESFDSLVPEDTPVSVPSLGIAYHVLNRIEDVQEGSPAAAAGLRPGDLVVEAKLLPPDKQSILDHDLGDLRLEPVTVELGPDKANWPHFFYLLQGSLPGTRVELELQDGRRLTLTPSCAADWFNPDRGFLFELKSFTLKAATPGEAIRLGYRETIDALTIVFRTVQKLTTQQVSPRLLGGPWTIAKFAYYSAEQGLSDLLIFLVVISANLAVLNFLPIPVLDGGHMVFLAYEGIRGKPPGERVYIGLSYVGLVFILALMLWVLGLDFGLISRQ